MNSLQKKTDIRYIKNDVIGLEDFGDSLVNKGVTDILTTNYDKVLEDILCKKNGFVEKYPVNIDREIGEKVYSIRRKEIFEKEIKSAKKSINVWKIHGDIDNISSVLFGYDHYCGQLGKIQNYLKGKYETSYGEKCDKSISEKCNDNCFDQISWIEKFFNTDVIISGITLDFSEIDLWWILDKRARLIKQGIEIENKITYLYSMYDTGENITRGKNKKKKKEQDFNEKKLALEALGVSLKKIEVGKEFLNSIISEL